MKKALITGITGQDGSYLAELLLEKGYEVHGIKRRASLFNTQRVDHLFRDLHEENVRFKLHYGDLSDASNLTRLLSEIRPDEVYRWTSLAAAGRRRCARRARGAAPSTPCDRAPESRPDRLLQPNISK